MGRESAVLKMLGIVKSCCLLFFFWMDFLMLRPKRVYVGAATDAAVATAVDSDRHVVVGPPDRDEEEQLLCCDDTAADLTDANASAVERMRLSSSKPYVTIASRPLLPTTQYFILCLFYESNGVEVGCVLLVCSGSGWRNMEVMLFKIAKIGEIAP